jgi:hypothetical protein
MADRDICRDAALPCKHVPDLARYCLGFRQTYGYDFVPLAKIDSARQRKLRVGNQSVPVLSIVGDLSSSALSNLYYPPSNRGTGLVFTNVALSTGERMFSALVQEFVLNKVTPNKSK